VISDSTMERIARIRGSWKRRGGNLQGRIIKKGKRCQQEYIQELKKEEDGNFLKKLK